LCIDFCFWTFKQGKCATYTNEPPTLQGTKVHGSKFVAPSALNIQSNRTFEDDHDDGACWNSLKILVFFIELMAKYERRRPTIMTNIGGHQFRHSTNCNITMSILYQSTIGDFLWSMQECKKWFCNTFFFILDLE
jgi:hypothetical protein